jgi:hypothetical protein
MHNQQVIIIQVSKNPELDLMRAMEAKLLIQVPKTVRTIDILVLRGLLWSWSPKTDFGLPSR